MITIFSHHPCLGVFFPYAPGEGCPYLTSSAFNWTLRHQGNCSRWQKANCFAHSIELKCLYMEQMNFPSEMVGDIERIGVHSQRKCISDVVDSTPFSQEFYLKLSASPTNQKTSLYLLFSWILEGKIFCRQRHSLIISGKNFNHFCMMVTNLNYRA